MDDFDVPIELVARGSFGVVVSLFSDRKKIHTAAKVQLVSRDKSDREYEILRDLSELQSTPCSLRVYRCDRVEILSQLLSDISGFEREVPSDKVDKFVYQIVKMELIHGPSLRKYLSAHSVLRSPLGLDELKGISFHLFWAISGAQKEVEFRHRDLKLANVMLRHKDEIHCYGEKGWVVKGKVPVVIDCNLSISKNNPSNNDWRCGTVSYMPPEKIYGIRKSAEQEGFEHDPWSLGIMLVSMCLTGRSFGKSYPEFPKFKVFDVSHTETIFQLRIPYEHAFKRIFQSQLPECDWTSVRTAIGLSLFQEALGNGPFPGVPSSSIDQEQMIRLCFEAWPEFAQTRMAQVLIKNWKSIKATIGNVPVLIEDSVSIISSQIGRDIISLLEDLMTWVPGDRLTTWGALNSDFYNSLVSHKTERHTKNWLYPDEMTCEQCNVPTSNRCSRCKKAFFCSQQCIRDGWDLHSRTCK